MTLSNSCWFFPYNLAKLISTKNCTGRKSHSKVPLEGKITVFQSHNNSFGKLGCHPEDSESIFVCIEQQKWKPKTVIQRDLYAHTPKHNKNLLKNTRQWSVYWESIIHPSPWILKFYITLLFTPNWAIKPNCFSHCNFSLKIKTNNRLKKISCNDFISVPYYIYISDVHEMWLNQVMSSLRTPLVLVKPPYY